MFASSASRLDAFVREYLHPIDVLFRLLELPLIEEPLVVLAGVITAELSTVELPATTRCD